MEPAMITTDLNQAEVIALPGARAGQKNVGLQVHWRLTGFLEKERFHKAMEGIIPEKFYPKSSHNTEYLSRAMEAAARVDRRSDLVRKVGKGKNSKGLCLVTEDADLLDLETHVDTDEEAYTTRLNVRVGKDGEEDLVFTPNNHPQKQQILEEYERQKTLYSANDLSQWLSVKIMDGLLSATSYRPRGGIYVISPGEDIANFIKIAEAIHSISVFGHNGRLLEGCKIYTVPVVANDHLAEAMLDSLMEELDSFSEELSAKIDKNELSLAGWKGQRTQILSFADKLEKTGEFLGKNLTELTGKLDDFTMKIGFLEAQLQYEEEAKKTKKSRKGEQ